MVMEWTEALELTVESDTLALPFHCHLQSPFAVVLGQLLCSASCLFLFLVLRDLLCCEIFNIIVSVFDFAQVLPGKTFLCFSFAVLPIKLFTDDGAHMVHLSGFGPSGGACFSTVDGVSLV